MYKGLKNVIFRPTGNVLVDKFQRDVIEALKAFLLSVYDKLNSGLVPAPNTDDHTQILYDAGWGPLPAVTGGTTYFPGGW